MSEAHTRMAEQRRRELEQALRRGVEIQRALMATVQAAAEQAAASPGMQSLLATLNSVSRSTELRDLLAYAQRIRPQYEQAVANVLGGIERWATSPDGRSLIATLEDVGKAKVGLLGQKG